MKKATKFNLRTLLVLILSVTLCFTAVFAACNANDDSSSSDSSSSTEETTYPSDTQLLKNGDFEYSTFTKENTDFPVSSSISWTIGSDSIGSSSAPSSSSKYPSGIIDTADKAYEAIQDSKNLPEENPRTPEYYKLVDTSKMYSMSQFDEDAENEDNLPMSGTKILMIHNHTTNDGEGTARKFTSSSVTLARNEFAELSVWIKTVDLSSEVKGATYGAYVSVQSTVSSSAASMILKNIDTKGEWAKYTVYLSSSDFSTSSFKLVLGLGFGSAKKTDEFVQGYAFFDNAVFKTIDKKTYETAVSGSGVEKFNLYDYNDSENLYEENDDKIFDQSGETFTSNGDAPYGDKFDGKTAKDLYTEKKYALSHTRDSKLNSAYEGLITGGSMSKTSEKFSNATAAAVGTMNDAYTATGLEDGAKLPLGDVNEKAVYFVFDKNNPTSYTYTSKAFTLGAGGYLKLSFWVKAEVAEAIYKNALTVTLNDLGKAGEGNHEDGSNIKQTVVIDNQNTNDYENDDYNGWRQYVIFVSNTIDKTTDRDFELEFRFGVAADDYSNDWDLTAGFAIIGNFEGYYMTANDYSIADTSSYTYSKKISLSADLPNGADSDDDSDDSYNFSYSESDKLNLVTTGTTNGVNGFSFVKAGSHAVGGTEKNSYGSDNPSEVAGGLISSKYNADFSGLDLAAFGDNENLLSMYISAKTPEGAAYGFIGSSATFSANTTTYVSLSVYAVGNATANFYLTSPDALDGFRILSLTAKDYTWDSDKLTYSYKENDLVNVQFAQTVTADSCNTGKWYTLGFLVTTGNEDITYRPEFWLGDRNGTGSVGTVYFDNYVTTTVSANEKKTELKNAGAEVSGEQSYTRIPSVIKYNQIISSDDSSDDSSTEDTDVKKTFETYEATVISARYKADNLNLNVLCYDFSTVDVEHEIDKTTVSSDDTDDDSSSEEDSTESDGTDFNWALQLTSIIIAAVLIALLVIVFVKMLVDKTKSKKSKSVSYYNLDSREKTSKEIERKKVLNAAKAENQSTEDADEEEQTEYDYDNPEINNNDALYASDETVDGDTTDGEPADGTDSEGDGDGSAE